MSKLWLLLRRLFTTAGGQPPTAKSSTGPQPRKVDDYLDLLDGHPGTRITTVRLIEMTVTFYTMLDSRIPRNRVREIMNSKFPK